MARMPLPLVAIFFCGGEGGREEGLAPRRRAKEGSAAPCAGRLLALPRHTPPLSQWRAPTSRRWAGGWTQVQAGRAGTAASSGHRALPSRWPHANVRPRAEGGAARPCPRPPPWPPQQHALLPESSTGWAACGDRAPGRAAGRRKRRAPRFCFASRGARARPALARFVPPARATARPNSRPAPRSGVVVLRLASPGGWARGGGGGSGGQRRLSSCCCCSRRVSDPRRPTTPPPPRLPPRSPPRALALGASMPRPRPEGRGPRRQDANLHTQPPNTHRRLDQLRRILRLALDGGHAQRAAGGAGGAGGAESHCVWECGRENWVVGGRREEKTKVWGSAERSVDKKLAHKNRRLLCCCGGAARDWLDSGACHPCRRQWLSLYPPHSLVWR